MIYGLDTPALTEGYMPLEAVVVLKCLDDEGDVVLLTRSTGTLKVWDRIGMLTAALDLARASAQSGFTPDLDEDDDPG